MKIGDEVFVHGYVDEIRKDCIIIRNEGGYFGTVKGEIIVADTPQTKRMTEEEIDTMLAKALVGQTDCSWRRG